MTKFRYQKYKKDSASKLLLVAKNDLYAADFLLSAPMFRPETVLYHVQQAIEKSLKSLLISLEKPVPLVHDLDVIVANFSEEIQKELPQNLGELTQYATIRRYVDGDELIEKKDILEIIKIAESVIKFVESNECT